MCVTLPAPKTIRRIDRFGQIVVVRSLRSEGAGAFSGYALEKSVRRHGNLTPLATRGIDPP